MNKKSTSKKRPVVARKVEPVVRPCSWLPRVWRGYYVWKGEVRYKYECKNGAYCEKCELNPANNKPNPKLTLDAPSASVRSEEAP